jgi:predicted alpha/beta superfamily hydrolase
MRIFNYISENIQLLSMNAIEPVVIVGVVTEGRWDEFLPTNNHAETLERYEPPMGNADKLIEHIQTEIAPYLKKNIEFKIIACQSDIYWEPLL